MANAATAAHCERKMKMNHTGTPSPAIDPDVSPRGGTRTRIARATSVALVVGLTFAPGVTGSSPKPVESTPHGYFWSHDPRIQEIATQPASAPARSTTQSERDSETDRETRRSLRPFWQPVYQSPEQIPETERGRPAQLIDVVTNATTQPSSNATG